MQVLDDELQGLVVGGGELPEEVLDLEEDPIELHADLRGRGQRRGGLRGGAAPRGLQLLNDDRLALLGQTDEVIVVAEENEGLWELGG